jgi:hypothetical protein
MSDIKLLVTQERLQRTKIGIYRKLESSLGAQFAFVARFMVGKDGTYLSEDDAYAVLDELELAEVEGIVKQLQAAMEEAAVPNG